MPAENDFDTVTSLHKFEKQSLLLSLTQRVNLLRAKKTNLEALFASASLPIAANEIVLDKISNPPSFFRRSPQDIVQEIRGILHGHFGIYEKLSIINAPKFPVQRTEEQFNSILAEYTTYANEQFALLLPELNHNKTLTMQ